MGVRHTALISLARLADDVAEALAPSTTPDGSPRKEPASRCRAHFDAAPAKKNVGVIRPVRGALDSMFEGMDAELMKQHASELIENIGALVGHDDYKVKVAAAGALGAIAESLDKDFAPYFEKVMHGLGNYLTIKETEEDLSLRSEVGDALGRIAPAAGPSCSSRLYGSVRRGGGASPDNPRLRRAASSCGAPRQRLREEFAPFLPGVFKGLFESLELEEEEIRPGAD